MLSVLIFSISIFTIQYKISNSTMNLSNIPSELLVTGREENKYSYLSNYTSILESENQTTDISEAVWFNDIVGKFKFVSQKDKPEPYGGVTTTYTFRLTKLFHKNLFNISEGGNFSLIQYRADSSVKPYSFDKSEYAYIFYSANTLSGNGVVEAADIYYSFGGRIYNAASIYKAQKIRNGRSSDEFEKEIDDILSKPCPDEEKLKNINNPEYIKKQNQTFESEMQEMLDNKDASVNNSSSHG